MDQAMTEPFRNKRILITGGCGTIGSELVRKLLGGLGPEEVIVADNHEQSLFLLSHRHADLPGLNCVLADVRDERKMRKIMHGVDMVFHTAALKHVLLSERSPFEAVQTNILGVQNVISAALDNGVERVIFTSSDKAVNPTNVMGTSKLMGERLITAANTLRKAERTVFSSVRFGNVLGSSGSVVPIFRNQIRSGGPVTLTDPAMTRFIMTIAQSVELILDSALLARGGEIFITKMPAIRIADLARVMIDRLAPAFGHEPAGIRVDIIGAKPGEKMYEELMTEQETPNSLELPNHFVVLPALRGLYRFIPYDYPEVMAQSLNRAYVSANLEPLGLGEIGSLLDDSGLLDPAAAGDEGFHTRHWPE
jgi:FlaA1/EpsC-like NDP-sugar epimerase